jgi:hypothetical protein
MIDPRQILFGSPPLQKGTIQIFVGLHLLLAAVVLLLVTHQDYWWSLLALGAIVGCAGGFKVSAPEHKNI